jgi:hypothetical protein
MKLQLINGTLVVPFSSMSGGLWPVLEGTIRPATKMETRTYDAALRPLYQKLAAATKPQETDAANLAIQKVQCEHYARHIKSWNVDAPLTVENIAALPPEIYDQLDSICSGHAGLILGNSEDTSSS